MTEATSSVKEMWQTLSLELMQIFSISDKQDRAYPIIFFPKEAQGVLIKAFAVTDDKTGNTNTM